MIEAPVAGPLPLFELAEWRERYGAVAGITGRGTGEVPFDLGLAGSLAPAGQVIDRWLSLKAASPGWAGIVVARQVHGVEVLWHDQVQGLVILEGADGHATDRPGVLLALTAADCVPVYILDPVDRRIALLHAGWRGTAAGRGPPGGSRGRPERGVRRGIASSSGLGRHWSGSAQADALDLKTQLLDRYPGSQVLQFKGPTGYWVRIRVLQDDKEKTRAVYQQTRVNEGGVFMVRLD